MSVLASSHSDDIELASGVFDRPDFADDAPHEQVVFGCDEPSGLRAIIGIHSTKLGPALGGTRFYPYRSEQEALSDVLRLSRGMTYKAAVAGLRLGGGKAVIIGDPDRIKTTELLEAHGRFIDTLGGRYITAGDVGTTSEDMDIIGRQTTHVTARTAAEGGSGDTAPLTALGVFHAILAAAESVWGQPDVSDRTVGVEGTGKVGRYLVGLLTDAGARVSVCDVSTAVTDRLRDEFPAVSVIDRVIDAPVDIYAPCALGATLTDSSAQSLTARIVCGAANNQLLHPGVENVLHERGVVWVPDYVANAGGLIQIAGELDNATREQSTERVIAVGETVRTILRDRGVLAGRAAHDLARARLRTAALQ
ncbi:Glu/Leu/Phe/Val family dehydrogenase [Mycolicibacterium helvum]|uniref:Valine dehydrogenase n=1 Tax=Mycolicibacterium helvum TaxID=1534349 RepID=A0A7I7T9S4_9MYCO|nr:Glu/Leu/Phe/Val dehydrogenase [Mycolicibacterium helvum]BBY66012.1 valine dehydrogenase [Mycolicibacterium helvum]